MASPVVVGTPAETAITTAGTSHVVNLPSGASGNLLLAIMDKGSTAATVGSLSGWNELLDENSANGLYIAWRLADGTEGATTTFTLSGATKGAWIVYEISGMVAPGTQAPQIGTTATGSGTTPDPPSVSVTGGSKDILTIACFGRDGEEADDDTWVTAAPSGFGSLLQKACGTVGTNLGGMVATAHLAQTTATANPGTFTCATGGWRAQTIVVHPVPPTSTAVAEVSLDAGSEPFTRTAHSIKVRARTTAGAGTLRAALYEGATNRSGDLESSALTTSLADYTLAIPDASAANITDYTNLSIRFWGYAAGGGSIVFEVDQLYLETPHAFIVKTGFGKVDSDGYGASQKTAGSGGGTKAGFAAAGLVGSGADVMLDTEAGRGVVGTVGSGASASVNQETGFATVGTFGAGPSASVYQEAGFATVGTVGTGGSASLDQPTGFGTVGLVGSGADAFAPQETGFATAGLAGAGVSASVNQDTGFGTVGTVGAGASVFISGAGNVYTKTGFASVGEIGVGADQDIAAETGRGVAGLVGAGAGASVNQEAGAGIAGTVGAGAKQADHSRSGYATAGLIGAGSSASIFQDTGFGTVGTIGTGDAASVFAEAGFGKVGTVGTGASSRAGVIVKTGFGSVGLVGTGADVDIDTEAGAGIAGTLAAGTSASVFVERGYGTVGTVGTGARDSAAVKIKSGFGKAGLTASGFKTREREKTGYATVGTIATGTKLRVLTRTGTAVLTCVGAGHRNTVLARAGYATVGCDGYGYSDIEVFFTLLGQIHTGHIANPDTGSADGRENGHIADEVAGIVEQDREEDLILV